MPWTQDNLAPVETLLFRSDLVKVGSFICSADDPCFRVSKALDNDVFVMPKMPVWVRRDRGNYRFVEPGAILMHRAGQTLQRRRVASSGERTYWFGVHPEIFLAALDQYQLPTEEMGGALIVSPKFRYRMALLIKQLETGGVETRKVEEEVLSSLFAICQQRADRLQRMRTTRSRTADRQRRLVDLARAQLDEHLSQNVSLESIADATGTSLYHLCRVFREQTGLTMHTYRIRQRLWHVTECLIEGDGENLTELALTQGFNSHSHLSRVFQKQMGIPPSAMRMTNSAH